MMMMVVVMMVISFTFHHNRLLKIVYRLLILATTTAATTAAAAVILYYIIITTNNELWLLWMLQAASRNYCNVVVATIYSVCIRLITMWNAMFVWWRCSTCFAHWVTRVVVIWRKMRRFHLSRPFIRLVFLFHKNCFQTTLSNILFHCFHLLWCLCLLVFFLYIWEVETEAKITNNNFKWRNYKERKKLKWYSERTQNIVDRRFFL